MFKSLSLSNFGHHRERVFEFAPTTLIVGANGSGKTTILNALKGSITGDWGCTKVEAITVGSEGPSKVSAILESSSGMFGVTRYLSSELTYLTDADGRKVVSGANAVNKEVLAKLDTTKTILEELVFTDQGEIGRIISGTRSQRQSALMRLFGVERMEKIAEAIRVPVATSLTAYDTHIEETRQDILRTQAGLVTSQEFLRLNTLLQLYSAADDPDLILQRDYLTYQSHIQAFAEADRQVRQTEIDLNHATVERDSIQDDLQELEGAKFLQGAEAGKARETWIRYEASEKTRLRQEQVRGELLSLQQEAATCVAPEAPAGYILDLSVRDGMKRLLNSRRSDQMQAQLFVSRWCTRQACPECGRDAPELLAKATKLKQDLEIWGPAILQLDRLIQSCETFDIAMRNWDNWTTRNYMATAAKKEELDSIKDRVMEVVNTEELQGVILEDARLFNAVRDLQDHERHLSSIREIAVGAYTSACDRYAKLMCVDLPIVTFEVYEQAQTRYTERQHLIAVRATVEANNASQEALLQKLQVNLEKLEQDKEKAVREQAATSYLVQLKEMFGRNGLPARITAAYLNQVCANVNLFLASFHMPFRVEVDIKTQFLSPLTPQGLAYSSGRLSGGQKAALAISFKAAVVSRFADKVGALILDEPTESMDTQNVRALGQVFSRLREVASAHKLQVIAVTHSMDLAPYFDRVIAL